MWAHLQREGIPVAKSTVERLMRRNGWQGVRRCKKVRTTIADPDAVRPPDLVDRQFGVAAPSVLLVADFTYVKLVTGVFVYVSSSGHWTGPCGRCRGHAREKLSTCGSSAAISPTSV